MNTIRRLTELQRALCEHDLQNFIIGRFDWVLRWALEERTGDAKRRQVLGWLAAVLEPGDWCAGRRMQDLTANAVGLGGEVARHALALVWAVNGLAPHLPEDWENVRQDLVDVLEVDAGVNPICAARAV